MGSFTRIFHGLVMLVCGCTLLEGHDKCEQIYLDEDAYAGNGVYTLNTTTGEQFEVFCQFNTDGRTGFIFLQRSTVTNFNALAVNLKKLHDKVNRVVVRLRTTSGAQRDTVIQQLAAYSNQELSIQFNAHTHYWTQKHSNLGKYLYVGILKAAQIATYSWRTYGFRSNGVSCTYAQCDQYRASYFSFIANVGPVTGSRGSWNYAATNRWRSSVSGQVAPPLVLPDAYFFELSIAFGGCGGQETTLANAGYTSAALGMPFDIKACESNPCLNGGTCLDHETLVAFTCTCADGYSGDRCHACMTEENFGNVSTSWSGASCLHWDVVSAQPWGEQYNQSNDQENYCLQQNDSTGVWCFIEAHDHSAPYREPCDLPDCDKLYIEASAYESRGLPPGSDISALYDHTTATCIDLPAMAPSGMSLEVRAQLPSPITMATVELIGWNMECANILQMAVFHETEPPQGFCGKFHQCTLREQVKTQTVHGWGRCLFWCDYRMPFEFVYLQVRVWGTGIKLCEVHIYDSHKD